MPSPAGRAARSSREPPCLIDSEAALAHGLAALRQLDPVIDRLVENGARPTLRKRPGGFPGLVAIVMAQQLSTASAAAIWGRLSSAFDPFTPAVILAASDEQLRNPGLSGPKIRTLRAIATAIASGALNLDEVSRMPPEEAHDSLTAVSGIGPWTADIYLMFCLGHPDAFAPGDLALQEAARLAYGLPGRPDPKALAAFSERWRPWRTVAAGVLWSHYRLARGRDGVR